MHEAVSQNGLLRQYFWVLWIAFRDARSKVYEGALQIEKTMLCAR